MSAKMSFPLGPLNIVRGIQKGTITDVNGNISSFEEKVPSKEAPIHNIIFENA